ncbi:MAG: M48 family metallopeptidase [Aeromonas molluscorum]
MISALSKVTLLAASTLLLGACAQSPTGRSQMLLFSPQQMNQLGADSFNQMKQQEKVSKDAKLNAYVSCVAKAVTAQVPSSYGISNWEVVVFDSKQVNAFALPGGKIGVYSGLLNVAKNQDQLATVIGHELTHVLAQHSNERLSRDQLTGLGLAVADAALGSSQGSGAAMAALGLGVQVGVSLPYGREQESEADRLGLDLMARAGFNPAEAIPLWQNMGQAAGGKTPPALLSTHPSNESRISELSAELATATPLYQQARAAGLTLQCKR